MWLPSSYNEAPVPGLWHMNSNKLCEIWSANIHKGTAISCCEPLLQLPIPSHLSESQYLSLSYEDFTARLQLLKAIGPEGLNIPASPENLSLTFLQMLDLKKEKKKTQTKKQNTHTSGVEQD